MLFTIQVMMIMIVIDIATCQTNSHAHGQSAACNCSSSFFVLFLQTLSICFTHNLIFSSSTYKINDRSSISLYSANACALSTFLAK